MQADSTACDEMPRHYALCHTNTERKREKKKVYANPFNSRSTFTTDCKLKNQYVNAMNKRARYSFESIYSKLENGRKKEPEKNREKFFNLHCKWKYPETAFKFNLWHDLYTPIWGKNLRYSYYSNHLLVSGRIHISAVHFAITRFGSGWSTRNGATADENFHCEIFCMCCVWWVLAALCHRNRMYVLKVSVSVCVVGKHLDRWLSNCIVIFRFIHKLMFMHWARAIFLASIAHMHLQTDTYHFSCIVAGNKFFINIPSICYIRWISISLA